MKTDEITARKHLAARAGGPEDPAPRPVALNAALHGWVDRFKDGNGEAV
jgi:hypothetical protein